MVGSNPIPRIKCPVGKHWWLMYWIHVADMQGMGVRMKTVNDTYIYLIMVIYVMIYYGYYTAFDSSSTSNSFNGDEAVVSMVICAENEHHEHKAHC